MPGDHVSVRVLSLVNEERNSYGLRSNEHSRYHAHCSRKVQRLRQNLKLTHGKGKESKKTPLVAEESLTDAHLQLSLFEAERAWTHSHELAADPAYADDGTLRHRATGRFRRAVSHSATLLSQARSLYSSDPRRISAAGFLEVTVYHLVLQGRFYLRRDDFRLALEHLAVAHVIFAELAKSATTSRDQAVYTLFSDEIAPQIRFAAHSQGHKASYDIDVVSREVTTSKLKEALVPGCHEIVQRLQQERAEEVTGSGSSGRAMLKEPLWEGTPVPVRNPELVDAFIKMQNADAMAEGKRAYKRPRKVGSKTTLPAGNKTQTSAASTTTRDKVAAFDGVLLALAEAQQVVQRLVESKELSGGADLQDGAISGGRDIHFVHAFITYRLLTRRIERDLLLVDSLLAPSPVAAPKLPPKLVEPGVVKGKYKEAGSVDPRINPGLVKLYDAILQSLEQMRNLSVVDESIDLVPSVESRLAFSRARRVLYLSRTYGTLKRYAEALSLTAKAHIYLREARSILSTSDLRQGEVKGEETYYPLSLDDISRAEGELAKEEIKTKMDWYAFNGGAPTSLSEDKHKKPMFYDVAFNYVELPMERLQARAADAHLGAKVRAPTNAPPIALAAADRGTAPQASSGTPVEKRERRATKVEDAPPAPEVKIVQSSGFGIGGILGSWWGRQ